MSTMSNLHSSPLLTIATKTIKTIYNGQSKDGQEGQNLEIYNCFQIYTHLSDKQSPRRTNGPPHYCDLSVEEEEHDPYSTSNVTVFLLTLVLQTDMLLSMPVLINVPPLCFVELSFQGLFT